MSNENDWAYRLAMDLITAWKFSDTSYKKCIVGDHFEFTSEQPFKILAESFALALKQEREIGRLEANKAIEWPDYDETKAAAITFADEQDIQGSSFGIHAFLYGVGWLKSYIDGKRK